jgi:hypothetical protein
MNSAPLSYAPVQGAVEVPSMEVINPPKGMAGTMGQVIMRIYHRVNGMIIGTEEIEIPVFNMRPCDIHMFMFMDPTMNNGAAPLSTTYTVGGKIYIDVEIQLEKMVISSQDVSRYCMALFQSKCRQSQMESN